MEVNCLAVLFTDRLACLPVPQDRHSLAYIPLAYEHIYLTEIIRPEIDRGVIDRYFVKLPTKITGKIQLQACYSVGDGQKKFFFPIQLPELFPENLYLLALSQITSFSGCFSQSNMKKGNKNQSNHHHRE